MAVAQAGTVQAAAITVSLTQTGVTQRIRTLEQALGVGLFKRSRKGMTLTSEGNALFRYCQKVLELEGETLALLDLEASPKSKQLKRVAIAGPSSLIRARVIPSLKKVSLKHSNLRFSFQMEDSADDCLARLKDGSIDLAIIPRELVTKDLDSKVLKIEEYIMAVPIEWAHRSLKEIVKSEVLIDFDEKDRLSFQYLEDAGLLDDYQGERHFVNNTDALASMIEMGMGYSVLSREFAEPLIAAGRIGWIRGNKSHNVRFALAWYPRSLNPEYLEATIAAIV